MKVVNNFPPNPLVVAGIRPQWGASWGSPAAPLLILSRYTTCKKLPREKN
jgi:hypothetical protein